MLRIEVRIVRAVESALPSGTVAELRAVPRPSGATICCAANVAPLRLPTTVTVMPGLSFTPRGEITVPDCSRTATSRPAFVRTPSAVLPSYDATRPEILFCELGAFIEKPAADADVPNEPTVANTARTPHEKACFIRPATLGSERWFRAEFAVAMTRSASRRAFVEPSSGIEPETSSLPIEK